MTKLLTCIGLIFYRAMLCVDGEFIEPPSSLVLRSFIGTQTRLPCRFAAQEGKRVVQVTWYRQKPGGERQQIIIGHFIEGPEASPDFLNRVQFESHDPTLDSTLLILDTKKVDQATYTCHITTFPSGNFERQINLTVWILPISTLEPVILQEGQSSRMAASCRSVGYPPPRLSWDTDITGQSQNRTGDNGLVISEFSLNPVRGMNGHRLDCLVWHPALDKPRRLQNNLIVQYPPDAEIHAFGSWRFGKTGTELRCAVKGNPPPHNITWSRKGGHLPDSVLVQGDKLIFSRPLNMTDKGVYVCQTANTVGSIKSEYKVEIKENTEGIIERIKAHSETMLIVLGASAAGSLVVIMVIILIYVKCHLKHKNRNLKRALSVQTEQMVSLSRQTSRRRLDSITSDPRMPDYSIMGDQRSRQGDYDYLGRPAIYTAFEPERARRKLRERDEEIKERQRRVASYVKSSDASLVITDSLYLTDDRNVAIFPNAEGSFSSLDLTFGAHYEVHGDSLETSTNSPATSAFASMPGQRRFSFTRPAQSASATTAHACRTWTRAINVAEVQDGKPVSKSVVMVRFSESEANVPGIVQKLQVDLRATEPPVLLDANWNEIMDSEGTRGSPYWRQNSRKINAMLISQFAKLHHRQKRMREEDSGLRDILDKIEEVLEASHGLEGVAAILRELTTLATRDRNQVNKQQALHLKQAFTCLVCRDIISEPVLSECCRSLVGCRGCIEQWASTSNQCVKCRSEFSMNNIIRVAGLSAVLDVVKELESRSV